MTVNKRLLTVLLVAGMCLLFAGCDAKRGYDSVLNQIQSPVVTQPEEDEPAVPDETDPETPQDDKPEETKPATDTPAATTPNTAADTVYPAGVPAPSYLTLISEKWENDTLFKAQYLMTKAQFTAWETALQKAKFSTSEPRSNGEWSLQITKLAQSAGSKADYRVVIELAKAEATWPAAFAAFPEFKGDGAVETEVLKDAPHQTMVLVSYKETKTAYSAYLTALKNAGFVDVGYGIYTKTETDRILEVETSRAWQDDTTLQLTYVIRPNS